jgi:Protein of unknown function (DUF3759)
MGLFGQQHYHHHHRDAYDAVYGGRRPHHQITHELLAAAIGFEAMRMYEHRVAKELLAAFVAAEIDRHFDTGRYHHLSRHEARRMAREQAEWLWQQQYGR